MQRTQAMEHKIYCLSSELQKQVSDSGTRMRNLSALRSTQSKPTTSVDILSNW